LEAETIHISLERKSGVSLYVQIKEALRDAILASTADHELVLPPQRELAQRLRVSRNTVSMAYAELEREGLVVAEAGRGTLVVDPARKAQSRSRDEALARVIEHAAEEALTLGYNLDQYAEATTAYLKEKRRMLDHIRLVFVECNQEQLTYYAEHLHLEPGVITEPVLLDDLRGKQAAALSALRSADVVVTSFYHTDELLRILADSDTPLVSVNLQPEMSTIVSIARIAPTARIGLVAASRRFLAEMQKTLRQMDVSPRRLTESVAAEGPHLAEFIGGVDALVVSPSRRRAVEALADGKPVVEFLFAPDDTSVNHIRIALVELKQRQRSKGSHAPTDHGTDVP
jgi:GntR family transcriptional regulator